MVSLQVTKNAFFAVFSCFYSKMPLDTKGCTFPCFPLKMSIIKHFSKAYMRGIDLSHFHHSQLQTRHFEKFCFFHFCYTNMKNQNCGTTTQVGRLVRPQIDVLGYFTLQKSSRAIMEVDILHTTHMPRKLFHSL